MMKKLIALFIPLLLLCGCGRSAPELTKEEYKDAVYSAWQEFIEGTGEYVSAAVNGLENSEEAKQACDKMSGAFTKFEEMNPPEEYKERHKKLLKSIEAEKQWNSYREDCINAGSAEESDKILDKLASEINDYPADETFPHLFMELYRDLGGFENG